jgi:hypothetical protein
VRSASWRSRSPFSCLGYRLFSARLTRPVHAILFNPYEVLHFGESIVYTSSFHDAVHLRTVADSPQMASRNDVRRVVTSACDETPLEGIIVIFSLLVDRTCDDCGMTGEIPSLATTPPTRVTSLLSFPDPLRLLLQVCMLSPEFCKTTPCMHRVCHAKNQPNKPGPL